MVDRPLIQHVVDEAREAGIEHFIFVTGRNKGVIEDHFDRQFELEHTLHGAPAQRRSRGARRATCRARAPRASPASNCRSGLGHAVWCARELVGHEPFALLLPDVLVQHKPRLPRADDRRRARRCGENANIIAVEEVPPERVHMYGVVGVGERKGKLFEITADGREAAAREGAVEPHHHRPLHPAAGNLRHPGRRRSAAPAARSSSPTR